MRSALVTMAAVAAALLVPTTPADAATPKCQGKTATVVGKPNRSAVGTKGDDVIVTNGAYAATGGEGDDLLCITKAGSIVKTGPGDDTVVVLVKNTDARGYLGDGDDHYLGGGGVDRVDPGTGKDVVKTYGGEDVVSLNQGHPEAKVYLGAGDDMIYLGLTAGGSRVDGGSGTNTLQASARRGSSEARVWKFDAVRGRVTLNTRPLLRYDNLQTYDLLDLGGTDDRVVVKGTADDETVNLGWSYRYVGRRLDVDLGRGDDEVVVSELDSGTVELGRGRDRFTVTRATSVAVDLAGSVADVVDKDDATHHYSLSGADDVMTHDIPVVTIDGHDGANTLATDDVCAATIHGLGGDDTLVLDSGSCDDDQLGRLYGDSGDDELRGSYRDDLLDGGEGTDSAIGLAGQDTCYAETTKYCELP